MNITTLKKKIESVWYYTLLKKEQKYVWERYRDRADYLAQLYPKVLAFHSEKNVKCLSCETIMTDIKQANWSHWIDKWKQSSWNYWCRREEWNIYCCCINCNAFNKEAHHNNLTIYVISKYWLERAKEKTRMINDIHDKPSYEDIKEVVEKYEKLLEDYI